MSALTPREAANEVERVMARTMPLRNQEHLRVLIDHVRATTAAGNLVARAHRALTLQATSWDQHADELDGDGDRSVALAWREAAEEVRELRDRLVPLDLPKAGDPS